MKLYKDFNPKITDADLETLKLSVQSFLKIDSFNEHGNLAYFFHKNPSKNFSRLLIVKIKNILLQK